VHSLVCIWRTLEATINAATTFNAILMMIAKHCQTGLKRAVPGGTAERVVRHAPCPVLVVLRTEHEFVKRDQPSTEAELL
jgi:hypothetical protein